MADNIDEPHADDAPVGPEVLPLDGWHRARGARMVEFAGYWMPVQYDGIIAEHLWTRESAGLFDVSHMGQLEVSGEGAAAALETLLPIDLATLKPGRQRYSLLLDADGGVLDDLMLTNRGEQFYLVVNGATKWEDIGHLREHLPDEITLNHLDEQALLALQGPKAVDALARLVPGVAEMVFMDSRLFAWSGIELGISRSGYSGEDGFEISVPATHVEALADALLAQPEVKPVGLGARDSLRLEAGLPLYGHDLSLETGPVEAGLTFAINKRRRTQGGFMGAERTLHDLAQGTARRWAGLALEGRMAAREGALVMQGEREVGRVTSGGFSPSLNHPIALAYIDSALAEPGTPLEIDNRGRKLAATVVALPFIPHRYHR
ncbi:MAG TPA: glycine cleavage system aminomethyltransferase GcvT [Novosphingobium sp.]|nr:glycine cleavage system aminomethyltransferase GcvT [Novosphingobium sp.]